MVHLPFTREISITDTPCAAMDLATLAADQVSIPPGCRSPSSVYSWLTTRRPCVELEEPAGMGKKCMPSWCMPACCSWSAALLLASGFQAGPFEIGSPQA